MVTLQNRSQKWLKLKQIMTGFRHNMHPGCCNPYGLHSPLSCGAWWCCTGDLLPPSWYGVGEGGWYPELELLGQPLPLASPKWRLQVGTGNMQAFAVHLDAVEEVCLLLNWAASISVFLVVLADWGKGSQFATGEGLGSLAEGTGKCPAVTYTVLSLLSQRLQPFVHTTTAQCKLHIVHCKLHSEHWKLSTAHWSLKIVHFSTHTANWTLYMAHPTWHTAHCILIPAHYKMYTAHCLLRTIHCTLHP